MANANTSETPVFVAEQRTKHNWPCDALTVDVSGLEQINPLPPKHPLFGDVIDDSNQCHYMLDLTYLPSTSNALALRQQDVQLSESHKYHIRNGSDDEIVAKISVTGMIGTYHEPFLRWEIAAKVSRMRSSRYFGKHPRDIIAMWDDTARIGTKVHASIEIYINTGFVSRDEEVVEALDQFIEFERKELHWLGLRFYRTEPRLYAGPHPLLHPELSVGASVDGLLVDDTGAFWLMDWKCNERFDKKKHEKYSLQMHVYGIILLYYYGIHVHPNNMFNVIVHKERRSYTTVKALPRISATGNTYRQMREQGIPPSECTVATKDVALNMFTNFTDTLKKYYSIQELIKKDEIKHERYMTKLDSSEMIEY